MVDMSTKLRHCINEKFINRPDDPSETLTKDLNYWEKEDAALFKDAGMPVLPDVEHGPDPLAPVYDSDEIDLDGFIKPRYRGLTEDQLTGKVYDLINNAEVLSPEVICNSSLDPSLLPNKPDSPIATDAPKSVVAPTGMTISTNDTSEVCEIVLIYFYIS
jgi:hypothetical protein